LDAVAVAVAVLAMVRMDVELAAATRDRTNAKVTAQVVERISSRPSGNTT
jgi:hypothetical protein